MPPLPRFRFGANSAAPYAQPPPRRLPIMTCGTRFLARLSSFVVGAALVLVGSPAPLSAQGQATTGIIRGVVTDPNGAPVANATVLLHEAQTNFTRTLTTDAAGNFAGTLLPLGTYDVTVRSVGYAEVKWTGRTSTTRSSASSAAGSDRRLRSTSTRCKSSSWSRAGPTPSSGVRPADS